MAKVTEIMLLEQPEQPALLIENKGDINTFSRMIGEGYTKIGSYLEELGGLPADIPFAEYPAYENMTDSNIHFFVGFYTSKQFPGKENIKSVIIPARKIVVCLHKGTYDELAKLYNEMAEWIKDKGYKPSGTSIEHYYTGPEVPETEHITRIVMPIE